MKKILISFAFLFMLNSCVDLYTKQPLTKAFSGSSPKAQIPYYNRPMIDAFSNAPFYSFIERHFGNLVHLNMEIYGDSPFIEVDLDNQYFIVVLADEACAKMAQQENIALVISCGGTEYNFDGEGYDFYWNRTSYILSGYFLVPENGGQVHQGIYGIRLEAVPRKEVLLRGLR